MFFLFFSRLQNFKMFEQSLDNEYFNNPYTMNQHEARFYDDYHQTYIKPLTPQHLHQQQPQPIHSGLPTPPSTPDKIPMNYGNFPHQAYLPQIPQHHNHHGGNPFSPNGGTKLISFFLFLAFFVQYFEASRGACH